MSNENYEDSVQEAIDEAAEVLNGKEQLRLMMAKAGAIVKAVEQVKQMQADLKQREEQVAEAKASLAEEMRVVGVEMVKVDGVVLKACTKFVCHPNKSTEESVWRSFLSKIHAEFLLKKALKVPGEFEEQLRAAGIAYTKATDVNTTSLKAAISSALKQNLITVADVPEELHFLSLDDITLA